MEAKPWYASKTLITNLVAGAVAIATAFGLDLGMTPEAQTAIVGGIMAVANIILRLTTKGPISGKPPKAPLMLVPLAALLLPGCVGSEAYEAGRAAVLMKAQATSDRVVEDAIYVVCQGGTVRALAKALPTQTQRKGRADMCTRPTDILGDVEP